MFIKNIKKSSPHAPGRNYIFIISQLPHFCSDNFSYTHPTRNPYHKRQTEYICLSKNGLQKNNRQKIRNAQQNLCCPHEQHIQPIRCHAAYRTKYDCNTGRYHSCCISDCLLIRILGSILSLRICAAILQAMIMIPDIRLMIISKL